MGRKLQGTVSPQKVRGIPTGKFRAKLAGEYIGLFDDETDAWRAVNAAIRMREGRAPDLLSVYGPRWLDKREKAGHVRDIQNERSVWNHHIASAFFFDWPLKSIKPMHIQQWLGELTTKEAVSPRRQGSGVEYKPLGRTISRETIGHARRVLRQCFAQARVDGKVSQNPVDDVPVPKMDRVVEDEDTWTYLTLAEMKRLFAVLPTLRLKALFAVAIYAGLRDGELLGLRWVDVILDGEHPPEIRVRRSYNGPTKTKKSRRNVPMIETLREALRAWKAEVEASRKAARKPATSKKARKAAARAAARANSALVFPSDHGGCYSRGYDADWDDRSERPVVRVPGEQRRTERDKSADVDVTPGWRTKARVRDYVRFHDLRHTCASHLRMGTWTERPLELHEIRDWLGHTNISVTQRYAHLDPRMLQRAVRRPNKGNLEGTGGSESRPQVE